MSLTYDDVMRLTRYTKKALLAAIKAGEFPQPIWTPDPRRGGQKMALFNPDDVEAWFVAKRRACPFQTRAQAQVALDSINQVWALRRKWNAKPGTPEHAAWLDWRKAFDAEARRLGFAIDDKTYMWKFSRTLEALLPGKLNGNSTSRLRC